MIKLANIRTTTSNKQWKLRLLSIFYIILICSQVALISNAYSQNETEIHPLLAEGTFFSYTITTGFIREWNYTIDGSSIITHNGSAFYAPQVSSTINIRFEFIADTTISVRYQASTDVGYNVDYAIEAEYDSNTGQISITTGSLSGVSGTIGLFSYEEWIEGVSTISEIGTWNITSELTQENIPFNVIDEYQIFSEYTCTSYDSVDGEITHHRRYDSDTGLLLQSSGAISDPFISGLGNISYFVGQLILTDTNFDLGPPQIVSPISIELILGIAAIGVFGVLYVVFYKAQRKPSKTVSKKRKRGKIKKQ